jgi:hypothetical protein
VLPQLYSLYLPISSVLLFIYISKTKTIIYIPRLIYIYMYICICISAEIRVCIYTYTYTCQRCIHTQIYIYIYQNTPCLPIYDTVLGNTSTSKTRRVQILRSFSFKNVNRLRTCLATSKHITNSMQQMNDKAKRAEPIP